MSTTINTPAQSPGLMVKPWRLALIANDHDALKVGAAYYTLPIGERDNLAAIAEISGVEQGVTTLLTRLRAAGMLDPALVDPPSVLEKLLNSYAVELIEKLNKR